MVYARAILKSISRLDRLLLPIVLTIPDTRGVQILPFAAVRSLSATSSTEDMELVCVSELEVPISPQLDLKTSELFHLANRVREQERALPPPHTQEQRISERRRRFTFRVIRD